MMFVFCSQKEEHIKNARKFILQWNYDQAMMEILQFKNEKDAEIQYLLGYCYLKKNEYVEANNYFNQSLMIDTIFKDSIIGLYTKMANNALKISDLNRALILYQELANLIPEYKQADNLFLMGNLYFEQDNYPAALDAYMKAYQLDSLSETAKKSMKKFIKVLMESDSLEMALRLAQREYDRSKIADNILQLGEIKFLLGERLFRAGLSDSAKKMFLGIIALQEPKSLIDDAYFYLGEIHLAADSLSQALESYKKVIRLNPYQKGELVKRAQERIKEIKEKR